MAGICEAGVHPDGRAVSGIEVSGTPALSGILTGIVLTIGRRVGTAAATGPFGLGVALGVALVPLAGAGVGSIKSATEGDPAPVWAGGAGCTGAAG